MLDMMTIAGIIMFLLLAVTIILTPFWWYSMQGDMCCLPFFIVAIFLILGVVFIMLGVH